MSKHKTEVTNFKFENIIFQLKYYFVSLLKIIFLLIGMIAVVVLSILIVDYLLSLPIR